VTHRIDCQRSKTLRWTVLSGKAGNCIAVQTARRLAEHIDVHQHTFENMNIYGNANFLDKGSSFPAIVFKLVSRFFG